MVLILGLSGAPEHAPGASRVSIAHPRRDSCWRCHRWSSATRRGLARAGSDQLEGTGDTRDPRRPKRLVVVTQGRRGHPAAGSRRRTPNYKFTSTKVRRGIFSLRPSIKFSTPVISDPSTIPRRDRQGQAPSEDESKLPTRAPRALLSEACDHCRRSQARFATTPR